MGKIHNNLDRQTVIKHMLQALFKLQIEADRHEMEDVSYFLDSAYNNILSAFYFMKKTHMFSVLTPEQAELVESFPDIRKKINGKDLHKKSFAEWDEIDEDEFFA